MARNPNALSTMKLFSLFVLTLQYVRYKYPSINAQHFAFVPPDVTCHCVTVICHIIITHHHSDVRCLMCEGCVGRSRRRAAEGAAALPLPRSRSPPIRTSNSERVVVRCRHRRRRSPIATGRPDEGHPTTTQDLLAQRRHGDAPHDAGSSQLARRSALEYVFSEAEVASSRRFPGSQNERYRRRLSHRLDEHC